MHSPVVLPGGLSTSAADIPANHEDVLGPAADPIDPASQAIRQGETSLADRIRAWGCDPSQARLVDFDGAELQIYRIANPAQDYTNAALLLIRGAQSVSIDYKAADSPLKWENMGDVAIFRSDDGHLHIVSANNAGLSHEVTSHLEGNIVADVWAHEVSIRCTRAGEPLVTISISRKPQGLFAFSHPATA